MMDGNAGSRPKVVDVPSAWLADVLTTRHTTRDAYALSSHALKRFCERYRPDLDPHGPEARVELEAVAATGEKVGPTVGGELFSAVYGGDVVPFVVRRDPKVARPVVVTVLPPGQVGMARDEMEDVVSAYLRAQDALKPTPKGKEPAPEHVAGVALAWINLEAARLKLAGKPLPRLADEVHALRAEVKEWRDLAKTREAKLEALQRRALPVSDKKLRAHLAATEEAAKDSKLALKAALRALTADTDDPAAAIDAALEAVRAVEPAFLTRAFLVDGLTKQERARLREEDLAALASEDDAESVEEGESPCTSCLATR